MLALATINEEDKRHFWGVLEESGAIRRIHIQREIYLLREARRSVTVTAGVLGTNDIATLEISQSTWEIQRILSRYVNGVYWRKLLSHYTFSHSSESPRVTLHVQDQVSYLNNV